MASSTIVATKLFIPQVRPRRVNRRRLIDRLNEGNGRRLTVILAPAGYGKTTLLSEWAIQSQQPVAWISLDEADNDVDRLLSYLFAALQAISPGVGMGEIAMAMRQSPQPLPLYSVLTSMINEMADYEDEFALVLDDYHAIDSQDIHDIFTYLLNYLPKNVHLVIASRAVPPLSLARLRARDELTELTADDLRFSAEESKDFLSEVMDLTISDNDIKELEIRTEGWIASLQLAAISMKGRDDPTDVILKLSGAHRYILDYLAEEVLSGQPEEIRLFLLQTSILERLTASLCDAVTGGRNSLRHLEHLEAENLFITALDSERRWYRYHRLFRDFLAERLALIEEDRSDPHLRAAGWYESEGLITEAIDHYLLANEHERAGALIDGEARELIKRGELTTLAGWIGGLPEEIIHNRPTLALAREWTSLVRDPIEFYTTSSQRMDRLSRVFEVEISSLPAILGEVDPASVMLSQLCEYAILMAFAVRQEGELDRAIALYEGAIETMPEQEYVLRALAVAGLGSVYARLGALSEAEQAFSDAVTISNRAGSVFFAVACIGALALLRVHRGKLELGKRTYHEGIDLLKKYLGPSVPLSGQVWTGLGDVYREQNDLEKALEYTDKGITRGERVNDFDALREGYITLARVDYALGDEEGYQEAIQSAIRVEKLTGSQECINEAICWEARLALLSGNLDFARRWADRRGVTEAAFDESCGDLPVNNEILTYARLLMADGQPADALKLLEWIAITAEEMNGNQALMEILVLQALSYQALGRRDEAMRSLARALLMGEPEGYSRVFLDEGPPMAALLRNAGAQGHSPAYVKSILTAFGEEVTEGAPIDPLSQRELEVLAMVAGGLTNREIAKELVIEVSTVKSHINRIYSNLGVDNRTRAVVRAREIGLV